MKSQKQNLTSVVDQQEKESLVLAGQVKDQPTELPNYAFELTEEQPVSEYELLKKEVPAYFDIPVKAIVKDASSGIARIKADLNKTTKTYTGGRKLPLSVQQELKGQIIGLKQALIFLDVSYSDIEAAQWDGISERQNEFSEL